MGSTSDGPNQISPFLKWAGGKRWLAMYYAYLFPQTYDRYLEPFLGGGAVFFFLHPSTAILSDSNAQLIECYQQLRDNPTEFGKHMRRHQRQHLNDDAYYYAIRAKSMRKPLTRAAQFLYLNRTCWNGLYRVNLNGIFNVPKGTKTRVVFDEESFDEYAEVLQGAKIKCSDYEKTIAMAKKGDFLFVDPPYTVKHNFNGFAKYNETIFSWADQIRLRASLAAASERGVKILLCNAHHESVLELFSDLGTTHVLNRRSIIAGEPTYRSAVTEIAISINYDVGPHLTREYDDGTERCVPTTPFANG